MSYRELRDATEILRALGFPRLVSVDNFRSPNFPLMAEILQWIVAKFDPNTRISNNIDSEADRVIFVKSCVLLLLQNARICLKPKNLYQSDGHAVRELLGALRLLYRASLESRHREQQQKSDYVIQLSALRAQINAKRQEIRRSMQLASKLPTIGANIYDLLAQEVFAKESRSRALSQMLNVGEVEREVRAMIEAAERRAADAQYKLANIAADEQDLERKIERRRREYDQLQKRLVKLQSFRPPYMDEYERLEAQLKELYAVYVLLFRNLSHLQQQLWEVERAERDRHANVEQTMRVAVDRMRMENNEMALGGGGVSDERMSTIAGIHLDDDDLPVGKEVKVVGNMVGAGLSDEDEEDDDGYIDDDGGVVLVSREAMAAKTRRMRQDEVNDEGGADGDDDESALLLRNANFSIEEPSTLTTVVGNGSRRFDTTMDDMINAGERQDDEEEFVRSRLDVIDEDEDSENDPNNNSDDDF